MEFSKRLTMMSTSAVKPRGEMMILSSMTKVLDTRTKEERFGKSMKDRIMMPPKRKSES